MSAAKDEFRGHQLAGLGLYRAAADDAEAVRRREILERFMRRQGGQLVISHVVLLEARNIFSRVTGEREPREWQRLEADFDGRLYVDPMNWDLLRRECDALFAKFAWKSAVGTFDTAIVASVKLAGRDTISILRHHGKGNGRRRGY